MSSLLTPKSFRKAEAARPRLSASILIVDNNPSSLQPASGALALSGYIVEHASDEGQIQAILGRAIPNLILLHLALPGVDDLARSLRADHRTRHVPIVALTVPEREGGVAENATAGYDGTIVVPVATRQLALRVAAYLVRGPARGSGNLLQV